MKSRNNTLLLFFLLFLVFFVSQAFAEEAGRVTLQAQIDANNQNSDMQISVINADTKDVVQREEVSNQFISSLSINSRYIVYFKKAGHPAIRMIVDTHTNIVANYCINFSLDLKNLNPSFETGISIPVGTLKFDDMTSHFVLQPSVSTNSNLVAITSCGIENGLARF